MLDTRTLLSTGLLWLGGMLTMSQAREPNRWPYPETPERPVADEYHGVEVVD